MNKYILMSLLAATALTACTSLPEPKAAAPLAEAPANWVMGEALPTRVEAGWIAQFNDPLLTQLVEEAQAGNPAIATVEANVRRARALSNSARAGLFPEVFANASASANGATDDGLGDTSLSDLSLSASYEVDLWGRIREGASAARLASGAAAFDEYAARRVLAAAVVEAYVLAIEAQLQVDVNARNFAALDKTLSFVTVQFERGLRSGRDIALIRSDAAAAEAGRINAENAERDALRALEVLIGRYPATDLALTASYPTLPVLPGAGLPAELLELRPDIMAAHYRLDAAWHSHRSARAATRPNLRLTGLIGLDGDGISTAIDPAGLAWNAAANFAAPLIDGGRRRADVDAAAADIDAAMGAYRDVVLTAWNEVEQQLDLGQTLEAQETLIETSLEEAEKAFGFTEYAYEIGEADLLDVLSLQQRVSALESQKVALRRARLLQFSQVSLALGGDWGEGTL